MDKGMDARGGRPGLGAPKAPAEGIPAEGVLHGSERKALPRAVGYHLLFRFDHSTLSQKSARLVQHDVAKLFFGQVVAQAQQARLMRPEHFSVDGTLIAA